MKKIVYSLIFVLTALLSFCVSVSAAQLYYNDAYHDYDGGKLILNVEGKQINALPMDPVIIDGRTMVPVREVFEALGAKVLWHDDTCQVEISDSTVSLLIKIGDRNTYVNGQLVQIAQDQPLPMLIGYSKDGLKSMVPVRFVAEKLGYDVGWDNSTRTVSIAKKKTQQPSQPDAGPIEEGYGVFGTVTASIDGRYDNIYIRTQYGISPKITRYQNPERIVFDFPGATFKTAGDTITLNGKCVKSVRYSNYNSQARVVFDVSASAQVCVMSSSAGILLRAENSQNTQIMYDAFSKRVYFDAQYSGSGSAVANGYKVTFTNLSMQPQKIEIHDSNIYEIIITKSGSGCTVSVDGSNLLAYSAQNGIYKTKDSAAPSGNQGNVAGRRTVIVDAGHGGYDPGAIGYNKSGEAVAYESLINLAIAKKVGEKLTARGIGVIYTRDTDNFISLSGRADIENSSNCDLFVSIHCNSIDNAQISGTQVYYHPESATGTLLAKNIYNNMLKETPLVPKNIQNGANLYVIRTTKSPAVLVETAFISNESDRSYLLSTSGQNSIAEAIVKGIEETLAKMN